MFRRYRWQLRSCGRHTISFSPENNVRLEWVECAARMQGGEYHGADSHAWRTGLAVHRDGNAAVVRDLAGEQDEGDLPRSRERAVDDSVQARARRRHPPACA